MIRNRRGESHIESLLERFYTSGVGNVGISNIVRQLDFVAGANRRRLLVVVVSDEPDVTPALDEVLRRLTGRHELMWLMIVDMPAAGSEVGYQDGFDVATGRFVLGGATLGPRVLAAYREAEQRRAAQLDEFLTSNNVRYARIAGSVEIRSRIVEMSEAYRNAG
jgi:hypothetical protein